MENSLIPGTNLRQREVVWAKISGYPWWPAEVVGYKEDDDVILLTVNFIGDESHAYLPVSKVVAYKPNREKYSKTKRKDLLQAIKEADMLASDSMDSDDIMSEESVSPKKTLKKKTDKSNLNTEEATITSKASTKKNLESLENVSHWLQKLVNSKKPYASSAFCKYITTALETINEKVTNHKTIIEMELGKNLNKIREIYEEDLVSQGIMKMTNETLENLKSIIMKAYFGSNWNFSKSDGEKSPDEHCEMQEVSVSSQLEINAPSTPLDDEDSIDYSSENETSKTLEMNAVSNADLRTNVCQEIAKFLEEVFSNVHFTHRKPV